MGLDSRFLFRLPCHLRSLKGVFSYSFSHWIGNGEVLFIHTRLLTIKHTMTNFLARGTVIRLMYLTFCQTPSLSITILIQSER